MLDWREYNLPKQAIMKRKSVFYSGQHEATVFLNISCGLVKPSLQNLCRLITKQNVNIFFTCTGPGGEPKMERMIRCSTEITKTEWQSAHVMQETIIFLGLYFRTHSIVFQNLNPILNAPGKQQCSDGCSSYKEGRRYSLHYFSISSPLQNYIPQGLTGT